MNTLKQIMLLSIILLTLVLLTSTVHAQAKKKIENAKPEKAAQKEEVANIDGKVIIHFSGIGETNDIAVGLSAIIEDAMRANYAVDTEYRFRTVETLKGMSGKKAANNQIMVKDLPYICLTTESNFAVLGWLEIDDERALLKIRDYDCIKGVNRNQKEVLKKSSQVMEMLNESVTHIENMFKLPHKPLLTPKKDDKKQKKQEKKQLSLADIPQTLHAKLKLASFDLDFLSLLGKAEFELEEGKFNEAIDYLISASKEDVSISNIFSEWIKTRISKIEKKSEKELDSSLKSRLDMMKGNVKAVLGSLKTKAIKDEKSLDSHIQAVSFLIKSNKRTQALQVLKALNRRKTKDPRVAEQWGWYHASRKTRISMNKAIPYFKKSFKQGSKSTRMLETLAPQLKKRKDNEFAGKVYSKLGDFRAAKNENIEANDAYIEAVSLGASDEVLNKINIKKLTKKQRKKVDKYLSKSSKRKSASQMVIRGKLAMEDGSLGKAGDFLEKAADTSGGDYRANLAAGLFFLNEGEDPQKAILFLKRVVESDQNSLKAVRALAKAYSVEGKCEEAIEMYAKATLMASDDIPLLVEYAKLQAKCNQLDGSIQTLELALSHNPDYLPALSLIIENYSKKNDTENVKKYFKQLKKIEHGFAQNMESMNWMKRHLKKKSGSKVERVKLLNINLNYPQIYHLVEALPLDVTKVLLIPMQLPDYYYMPNKVLRLLKPFNLDATLIHEDLKSILSLLTEVVDDEALARKVIFDPNQDPVTSGNLQEIARQNGADAVIIYYVEQSEAGKEVYMDFFCYLNVLDRIIARDLFFEEDLDKLYKFNYLVLLWTAIVIVLLVLRQIARSKQKWGQIRIVFEYESALETGYFAARLSKRKLSQAFKMEKMMSNYGTGEDVDVDKLLRKHFSSSMGLVSMARDDQVYMDSIAPGHYYVYIGGLMVQAGSNMPIGTHEMMKEVIIKPDETAHINVDLQIKEVYVRISTFSDREGKMGHDMLWKANDADIIGDAKITVNNDESLERVTLKGVPTEYYLPFGNYEINGRLGDLRARTTLKIDDHKAKLINLKLRPPQLLKELEKQKQEREAEKKQKSKKQTDKERRISSKMEALELEAEVDQKFDFDIDLGDDTDEK